MVKKGFLKKTGCILISASIILTGVTFFGSSVSDAGISEDGTSYTFTADNNTVADSAYAGNTAIVSIDDDGGAGANIGNSSFANCTSLETVTIAGAANVGANAFNGCTNLSSVYFGSVSSVQTSSFGSCNSLSEITIGSSGTYSTYDGALYEGNTLIYVPSAKTSLTVKSGTTAIAQNAFQNSNVNRLAFEDSSLTSFGSQTGWPLFAAEPSYNLKVTAPTANDAIENFFKHDVETYGETRCQILYDDASDDDPTPSTTYTITLVYELYNEDGTTKVELPTGYNNKIAELTVAAGATPSYDAYAEYQRYNEKVYKINSTPTFAPATENTTYTYKYVETNEELPTYTVEVNEKFTDSAGNTTTRKNTDLSKTYQYNETITAKTYSGYVLDTSNGDTSPYLVVGNAIITFAYKPSTSPAPTPSTKRYTVTVYDEFYKPNMSTLIKRTTRSSNTYAEGTTYSFGPNTYAGYSNWGAKNESGTVYGDVKVYFFYKQTDATAAADAANAVKKSEINTNLKGIYQVTQGANQTVTKDNGPVKIVCNGELNKLTGIFVDKVRIDPSRYTLESGSTILTFTGGFVKLFSTGDHVVRFEYVDGYAETGLKVTEGKTTTTVTYKVSSDGSISSGHTKDTTPKTADGFDNKYLLCIAIFLLGAGSILFGNQRKLEAILAGENDDE